MLQEGLECTFMVGCDIFPFSLSTFDGSLSGLDSYILQLTTYNIQQITDGRMGYIEVKMAWLV